MAQKLYKWTGTLTQPDSYDSSIVRPQWYGNNLAFLDTEFAKLCKSSNDDFAATTAADDKAWVKANSKEAKQIRAECQIAIRKEYGIEDELEALRSDDKTVKDAIAKIVAVYTKQLSALVGD
tara:strand:- start:164 stop:529 length:366 start_codon:yes stop_codon:yes gene_type:complete